MASRNWPDCWMVEVAEMAIVGQDRERQNGVGESLARCNESRNATSKLVDHGSELVAKDLRKWLADTGAKRLYVEPGSPRITGSAKASTRSSEMSSSREQFLLTQRVAG